LHRVVALGEDGFPLSSAQFKAIIPPTSLRSNEWTTIKDRKLSYGSTKMRKSLAGYVAFIVVITSNLFLPSFSCGRSNDPNSSSEHPKSFLDVKTILNAWESSYAHIDSTKVSYTLEQNFKPPASDPNAIIPDLSIHSERIEQGAKYHERRTVSKIGIKGSEFLMEHSFDGSTTREYYPAERNGTIAAGLVNRSGEKDDTVQRFMYSDLQKTDDEEKDMYPNGIPSLSSFLRKGMSNNTITIYPTLELVNGQLCHIIKKTAKEQGDKNYATICLAHEKGMLLIKFQRYDDGVLAEEYNIEEIASTKTEHGIFWYPKKASHFFNDKSIGTIKLKLIVNEFITNIAVKDSDFKFDLPNGTQVVDRVQGIMYTVGVEGSKKLPNSPGN